MITKRVRKPFTKKEKQIIYDLWKKGNSATAIVNMIDSLNGRKPQTLYPLLIKEGLYKKKPATDLRRHSVDDFYFSSIDSEEKAYWLGFMFADGYITISKGGKEIGMSLATKDKSSLQNFQRSLNTTYKIHDYVGKTSFGETCYSRLLIRSDNLYNDLASFGFGPDKTTTIKFPYDKIPKSLYRHFIRGYFDGDGSLSKSGGSYHTYDIRFTGTYEMMESIKEIIGKSNLALTQRYPERDVNNYSLSICGDKQVSDIMHWMYKEATVALERKYLRYFELVSKKYTA